MKPEITPMHPNERIKPIDIENEMKKSFLDYSMSVIVARALPDVRDGLKPVHRRILYSQFKKGLTNDKPYHKCADTVGSVLGEFHPHGDMSVYDALVRMAQPFSLRYPLVDGHGNFGSVDGDRAAAYRYTEARLAKISDEILRDINKNTVDWQPNYDDRLEEPIVLPSHFPNLLVNGSVGIAVGMATNIPPHNLGEVIDGLKILIKNPECTTEELMESIKAPDFPTAGIIMGLSGSRSAYKTGRGKITVRGKAEIVSEGNHQRILITEIPYMVNKTDLVNYIGQLANEKRIEGVSAIRDESDRNGMRVVIELKRDANAEVILNNLYKFSRLQENISVNMIALVNGEPKILNLKQMLEHYLAFREEITIRKTRFDADKAKKRAHILQGLMLAIDYIDEVISILRASRNIPEAKQALTERFKDTDMTALLRRALEHYDLDFSFEIIERGLSKEQIDAIVAMTLGQLTGLEREKTNGELAELMKKIRELENILSDRTKVLGLISTNLDEIKQKYGDERRSAIEQVDGEVDNEDLIPIEECVLTYTGIGYIKRQAADVYSTQGRGGKGVSSMKQRDEDFVQDLLVASTHDNILFVTNFGNMFRLKGFEIPACSRQSRGTNIVNLISLSENERVAVMLKTDGFSDNKYFVCVTKQGIIKRTALSEFKNLRKNSLRAIILNDGDEIASAHITEGDSFVLIATRLGYCIYFSETQIRPTGRSSHGVRAIRLRESDFVVGAVKVYNEDATILTVSEKGLGRRTHISKYRKQSRGGSGTINYRINEKTGLVCNICSLQDDDVIIISNDGIIIRIYATPLSLCSRYSRGVRLMKLSENQTIVNFTRTEHDDNAEIEEISEVKADDDDESTETNAVSEEQGDIESEEENERENPDETEERSL